MCGGEQVALSAVKADAERRLTAAAAEHSAESSTLLALATSMAGAAPGAAAEGGQADVDLHRRLSALTEQSARFEARAGQGGSGAVGGGGWRLGGDRVAMGGGVRGYGVVVVCVCGGGGGHWAPQVYNRRKRQEGGDTAAEYFNCTQHVAGLTDMRFQALMPDTLHWLGMTKIDRLVSMSDMKYNAIVESVRCSGVVRRGACTDLSRMYFVCLFVFVAGHHGWGARCDPAGAHPA